MAAAAGTHIWAQAMSTAMKPAIISASADGRFARRNGKADVIHPSRRFVRLRVGGLMELCQLTCRSFLAAGLDGPDDRAVIKDPMPALPRCALA